MARRLLERAREAGARDYAGWLPPGSYFARAKSLVLGDREASFEVPAEGDEVVRVELKPLR